MECFEDADFLRMMTIKPEICESAAECGHRSFVIMAGAFDRRNVDAHVLSYEVRSVLVTALPPLKAKVLIRIAISWTSSKLLRIRNITRDSTKKIRM